jgi:Kdo2-lipid IVA lauroyltransferase/acyltransferase
VHRAQTRKTVRSSPATARLVLAFGRLCAGLPFAWTRRLGRLTGGAVARVPNSLRAIADLNLSLCFPDLTDGDRRRLVRRVLTENGATVLEMLSIWRWPAERLRRLEREVEGMDLFERAMSRGRGTLLLAPHLGNWEFLNAFLMRHTQFFGLYRPPRIAELDDFMRRARQRTGCIMVPATPAGMRPLFKALRNNHTVLILPDQEPLKGHGVHAPFFGVPALTMTLVSKILGRTGCEALFVTAERCREGGFRIRFEQPPEGLADPDEERAAATLNRGVETCVRRCPEQYLWTYKRFLTAPPGEPTPYRAIWSKRRLRRNPWPPPTATPSP